MVLSNWQVRDFEFDLSAFRDTSRVRGNSNILVDLSLPHKIEIEVPAILQNDCLCLSLVDEKVAEIELVRLSWRHLHAA